MTTYQKAVEAALSIIEPTPANHKILREVVRHLVMAQGGDDR